MVVLWDPRIARPNVNPGGGLCRHSGSLAAAQSRLCRVCASIILTWVKTGPKKLFLHRIRPWRAFDHFYVYSCIVIVGKGGGQVLPGAGSLRSREFSHCL